MFGFKIHYFQEKLNFFGDSLIESDCQYWLCVVGKIKA